MWLTENAIRSKWRGLSYRVVFWQKSSMWECCAGGTRMTPYVMFSREFKQFSLDLSNAYFKGQPYNAVHVRRGGGHTRIDRRTAQHYLQLKIEPESFAKDLAIFVATDERNKTWFDDWKQQGYRILFWNDLIQANPQRVSTFLHSFPPRTKNDVIGFTEQLICGRAVKWTGSDGSTFSYSIEGMRNFPYLLDVDWQNNLDDKGKKIYAHDGLGVVSITHEDDDEKIEQQIQVEEDNRDNNREEDIGS